MESLKIPALLHFIWMGSDFKNPEFRHLVHQRRSIYPDYTCHLWTDREMDKETTAWCNSHDIKITRIEDFFRSGMECEAEYRLEMGRIPTNYGAASDILRYNILYRFGGLYCDVDAPLTVEEEERGPFVQKLQPDRTYDGNFQMLKVPQGNDYIATFPGCPIMRAVLDKISMNYKLTREELIHKMIVRWPTTSFALEVINRTGPFCLYPCVKAGSFGRDIKYSTMDRGPSAMTWVKEHWGTHPDEKCDVKEKVFKNLMWDLQNIPDVLDVSAYVNYFNWFSDPDAMQIEMFDFIRQSYPHLLNRVTRFYASSMNTFNYFVRVIPIQSRDELSKMYLTAVTRGHLEIAQHLLELGVVNYRVRYHPFVGDKMVFEFFERDQQFFLDQDVVKNHLRGKHYGGFQAIHVSIVQCNLDMVRLILKFHPDAIQEWTIPTSLSCLELAIQSSQFLGEAIYPIIEELLKSPQAMSTTISWDQVRRSPELTRLFTHLT